MLFESYKLDKINFKRYMEGILTRIMRGEIADSSFFLNNYALRQKMRLNVARQCKITSILLS